MSVDNLITCGLVDYQSTPMLTDLDISLTLEYLHDDLNFINPSLPSQHATDCETILRQLLSNQTQLYSIYTASITTTGSFENRSTNCSTASDQHRCGTVYITLSFGSRIVRTTETKPGILKQDIWISAGAIVGAVQFFAWLLRLGT